VSAGDDWVIWSWHCCAHLGFTAAVRMKRKRELELNLCRERE